jgi:hypothetical protein
MRCMHVDSLLMSPEEYLRVGLKGMNPSKAKWIEVGRVRELYPHLHID